ncbi:MAG: hypothetical protein OHK0019_31080 [Saprospiraceae bacterium]
MKRWFLLFTFCPVLLQAQVKFDNTWIFGDNLSDTSGGKFWGAILDFKETPPNLSFFQIPVDLDATAMISDSAGNLLFYSNGCIILNRKHEAMPNGDSINFGGATYQQTCGFELAAPRGYLSHQGILILPWPGRSDYYIMLQLHRPGEVGSGYLNQNLLYTTVDMTLDNGYGAVTKKNALVFHDTFPADFLTAARHGNGRDWWILLPKFNSSRYYAFLLSPEGISGPYLQENIALLVDVTAFGSQAAFSPNGKKYATASYTAGLQVFDFDRCTGKLSNQKSLKEGFKGSVGNGVAFSPNSRYLYVSSDNMLYQFDMNADSLLLGQTLVGVYDSFGWGQGGSLPTSFYQLMLAPNGKIYMTTGNGTIYLHVIHQPNEAGLACDFEQRGLELSTSHSFSPPNFPHFRLYDFQDSPCDTLGINGPPPPEDTTSSPPLCAGSIRVFPNPAQSIAYLEMPECEGGSVSVFDIMGRWVEDLQLQEESMSTKLDVSTYIAGIYFLRISTVTGEKVTKRLVVMRR